MNRVLLGLSVLGLFLQSAGVLAQEPPPAPPPEPTTVTAIESAPAAPPPAPIEPGSLKDASPKQRPLGISVMAWVPWWYGFGIGAKGGVEIPLAHDGFLPSVNDSFSLEPSLSIAHVDYGLFATSVSTIHILPALAGIWSFHFSERLRLYGAVALGYGIVTYDGESSSYYEDYGFNYFYTELNGGIGFKVSDAIALRGEVGWHGLRGGLQIQL